MGSGDYAEEAHRTPVSHRAPVVAIAPHKRPCLVMIAGPLLGHIFVVPEGEGGDGDGEEPGILIGRDEECDLRLLEDEGVSRRHARVVSAPGGALVSDLGSQNGTWIDGARIEGATMLREGHKIRVGQTVVLKFALWDEVEERAQRQLLEAALRDGLTRTFNRRYFMQRLAAELRFAERHRQPVALLICDLDHFKQVNDKYGHPRGDVVLRKAADFLAGALRAEDVLARYGGEEFAVILRGTPAAAALQVAERLRRVIGSADFGLGAPVTVSVGVAVYGGTNPEGAPTVEALVQEADGALYRAKQSGRDRVAGG